MHAPGSWGFYESYSTLVRVEESNSIVTNNRRGSSYFRGVLVDLQDNYSTELKENLLVSNFWTKESCNDPNILGKFALGEVAYQKWEGRNNKATAKPNKSTKQTNQIMGNKPGNSTSGNNLNIPMNVSLPTSITTTGERSSNSGDSDSEEEELDEHEEEEDINVNVALDDNNDVDDEELDNINFPKRSKGTTKSNPKMGKSIHTTSSITSNTTGPTTTTATTTSGRNNGQQNHSNSNSSNSNSSSSSGSGNTSGNMTAGNAYTSGTQGPRGVTYSSGLQGISRMFGLGVTSTNSTVNQAQINQAASRSYQSRRDNLLTNVPIGSVPNANTSNVNASSSMTSTSSSTNQLSGQPYNYHEEMSSRGRGTGSISSNSNSSLKSNNHSSISKSGNVELDPLTTRILNPEGQNSPANSLRMEDYEIDREKQRKLMTNTPRMAGHSGKHPTTVKTYAYVTDGNRCWLMMVDEHLEVVTALVYAMMSRKGLVGKNVEGTYWEEVLSRLISKENITNNPFHEIISQPLAVILATSNINKEYVKKWVAMGGTLLQTIKKKLNVKNGSSPIVDRLMNVLGQDSTRFKTILKNYTANEKQGNSLHDQALEYSQYDGDDPQEICALFIIERVMQEVGFIAEDDVPTKAVDYKDPWAKKYTFHDFILVLTLLTFGLVEDKVLKKPDIIRKSQGKKPRVLFTEEDIESNRLKREEDEEKLVGVKDLRAKYSFLEQRVLRDMESFLLGVRNNQEYMIVLSESRIKTFELWNDAQKIKGGRINREEGEYDEGDDDLEAIEKRRKRVWELTMDDDNDDD